MAEREGIMEEWSLITELWRPYIFEPYYRVIGFQKILEDVLHCDKISDTERKAVYRCAFKIYPSEVVKLKAPKTHIVTVVVLKEKARAFIMAGNLKEQLYVLDPLDLLNMYYVAIEWNKIRDALISQGGGYYFAQHMEELWKKFKKELRSMGLPLEGKERERLLKKWRARPTPKYASLVEKVLKTIARATDQTVEQILTKLKEIPKEKEVEKAVSEEKVEKEEAILEKILKSSKEKGFVTLEELLKRRKV